MTYQVFLAFALLFTAIGFFRAAFRLVRGRSIGWGGPPAKTRSEPLRPSTVAFLAAVLLVMGVACGLSALYWVLESYLLAQRQR
jgi:hypothetical protein